MTEVGSTGFEGVEGGRRSDLWKEVEEEKVKTAVRKCFEGR